MEAYDLDQAADSQLANIITPGLVEAGDNVMIGGIIVGGDADVSVLVHGQMLLTGTAREVMASSEVRSVYLGATGQARFEKEVPRA